MLVSSLISIQMTSFCYVQQFSTCVERIIHCSITHTNNFLIKFTLFYRQHLQSSLHSSLHSILHSALPSALQPTLHAALPSAFHQTLHSALDLALHAVSHSALVRCFIQLCIQLCIELCIQYCIEHCAQLCTQFSTQPSSLGFLNFWQPSKTVRIYCYRPIATIYDCCHLINVGSSFVQLQVFCLVPPPVSGNGTRLRSWEEQAQYCAAVRTGFHWWRPQESEGGHEA